MPISETARLIFNEEVRRRKRGHMSGHADSEIKQMFEQMREWGAAMSVTTYKDANDEPIAAIVLVDGREATAAVIAAVEPIQAELEA